MLKQEKNVKISLKFYMLDCAYIPNFTNKLSICASRTFRLRGPPTIHCALTIWISGMSNYFCQVPIKNNVLGGESFMGGHPLPPLAESQHYSFFSSHVCVSS